jgi:hypothetical protein
LREDFINTMDFLYSELESLYSLECRKDRTRTLYKLTPAAHGTSIGCRCPVCHTVDTRFPFGFHYEPLSCSFHGPCAHCGRLSLGEYYDLKGLEESVPACPDCRKPRAVRGNVGYYLPAPDYANPVVKGNYGTTL